MTTGIGVGATGAIKDYLYCLTCGETHEQALRSAAINGPIEGVTTGGLKFIGNAVASRVGKRYNAESRHTIWSFIKQTQESREGTIIPKSFELQAGDYKYWVASNATKHMHEYSTRHLYATPVDSSISPTQSMTEQILLSSFKSAVEEASKIGYTFEVPIKIGNWELIFSPAREEGLLTVIKHAVYML